MDVLINKLSNFDETYMLNLFFAETLKTLITTSFSFVVNDKENISFQIKLELSNTKEQFEYQDQFAQFNSLVNKQRIGHNYSACCETGKLRIYYPDFNHQYTSLITDRVNLFLRDFLSYVLTFFQRRRIIFGVVRIMPSSKKIFPMPLLMAGELIDSIGYGEPLIKYINLQICLNQTLDNFSKISADRQKVLNMLLIRYNDALNLPYTYERVESY